jgi:alpha-galactosidase
MQAVADKIHETGMRAGLWLAPFVCERDSKLFHDHPEWILRDERGDMVSAGGTWSDCFALDVRSDEVRSFVHTIISTVTRAWGFDFLKLDYLFAAASEVHDGLNRGQLMAEALDFLRECAGEATLLDFSGVPLVSAFGRCEYCRVGCDLTADWDDVAAKRILQRERRSTKNALANARGRAHLNGKAFLADPGYVSLLGTEINLTAAQRVQMLSTDCGCGGVLISADDLTAFDDESCAKAREHIGHFAQNQKSVVNTER